jgi:branched-chain amino acid transport system substrate-binding protein
MKHTKQSQFARPRSLRRWSTLGVAAVAVVALSGCQGGGGSASTIHVGFVAPLTGVTSAAGVPQQEGARLAVEQINSGSYLGAGKEISLIEADTKTDPAEAIAATQMLLSRDVVAVIGGTSTPEAGVIKPRMETARVPLVLLSSLDPSLTQSPIAFRPLPLPSAPNGANSQAAEQFAADGVKTAMVAVTADNDGHVNDAESWVKYLEGAGVTIVGRASANTGDSNLTGPAAQVADANPDLLIISMLPGQDAAFAKAVRDRGFGGRIGAYQSLSTKAAWDLAGKALDGVVVATVFSPDSTFPTAKEFSESFAAKYGRAPSIQNAVGYAATWFLARAIKDAQNPSADSIAQALAQIESLDTVYGPVRFQDGQAVVAGALPLAVWTSTGTLQPWRAA